jgi:hypothetical protein
MMPSSRPIVALALAAALGLCGCAQVTAPSSPASPDPSLTANYRLLIHCGIRYASFDGDTWEAMAPIPDIPDIVTDSNGTHNRYDIAGVMVRVSTTEARFTTTDPPVGVVLRFVRSAASIPGCA